MISSSLRLDLLITMAKFDGASLLLALCVTVILSSWMPISQSFPSPLRNEPYLTCPACEKLACLLYTQVQAKEAEISPDKISEQQILEIGKNVCSQEDSCDSDCKVACEEVWSDTDHTDVAKYIYKYKDKPDFDSLVNYICKPDTKCRKMDQPVPKKHGWFQWITKKDENSKNQITRCRGLKNKSSKSNDLKQRLKKGVVDAGDKLKYHVTNLKIYLGGKKTILKNNDKSSESDEGEQREL